MFEEIKDYQGRDLNTTELISLYSKIHDNTAFLRTTWKGSLRPIRFYLYFQRKNVT